MDADDVRTAEIDQPLHRRQAIVQGRDREQQIVAPFVESTHLGAGQFGVRPLLADAIERFTQ
jgi:hypothetical protein